MSRSGGAASRTVTFKPRTSGEHTLVALVEASSPERMTFSTEVRTGLWSPGPFAVALGVAFLLGLVLLLAGGFGRIE